MEKNYNFKELEPQIYKKWEERKAFTPKIDKNKKPFTIVLPPPNASGKMHTGNVLMIAIEDILIRWNRMKGIPSLWVPGTDHAGFETQITYEKALAKEGKSRFDFKRAELYQRIWDFVQTNRSAVEEQIKRMGASVDWSRNTFTLDPRVVSTVHDTFIKMYNDGLVYRGEHIVNYCPKCGTTFADLEIIHEERKDPLFYIKYKLVDRKPNEPEFLVVATVRPETIFVDTHLAVNPKDKKNSKWAKENRKVINPLSGVEMEFIEDSFVDPKFGTGIVKLTPAHDKNDFEAAVKHGLMKGKIFAEVSIVDTQGRMIKNNLPIVGETNFKEIFGGKKVLEARKMVMEKLQTDGAVEKIDTEYLHSVSLCYKGNHEVEPLVLPNWFVKVDDEKISFKKPAYEAVKKGEVKIYPKWREKTYLRWMEEMRDWPISRQTIWGIQIPVWYPVTGNENQINVSWVEEITETGEKLNHTNTLGYFLENLSHEEIIKKLQKIKGGLQRVFAKPLVRPILSKNDPSTDSETYFPETDTFDTWFSSGQWPLVTLGFGDPERKEDFDYFYPTSVLETGWEIIRFWVSRMMMFGIYLTGKAPFHSIYLHGLVRAIDGKKMSKSLGNVINPEEYIAEYGVDALRMGLISGTAGGKDFNFPKDKIIAYRNFGNKLWNMARFMLMMLEKANGVDGSNALNEANIVLENNNKVGKLNLVEVDDKKSKKLLKDEDKEILKKLNSVVKTVDKNLEKFRFSQAGEVIYQFMWHDVADVYIEQVKVREDKEVALGVLMHVYKTGLKLLHPFMPFVTEAIWDEVAITNEMSDLLLAESLWPSSSKI